MFTVFWGTSCRWRRPKLIIRRLSILSISLFKVDFWGFRGDVYGDLGGEIYGVFFIIGIILIYILFIFYIWNYFDLNLIYFLYLELFLVKLYRF
jgi:hypothetical protein